ncbi:MAG: glycosyltransferase family 4 protein, partial [Ilumatobacteraceae bacterium]
RARQALGLPADAAVVAYAGSLTAEKRVHHAVEAVADVRGLHLLVAGSGPDREALEARAARRAAGRVRFLGALDDVSSVLAAADAVVLTSTTEGMPGILVEAGLRARAVVAYDVGGVGEIVADGETGCLVRSGDVPAFGAAMRRVLADAAAMGAAGRQRCLDRFEIGVVAGPWAELIAEMAPR